MTYKHFLVFFCYFSIVNGITDDVAINTDVNVPPGKGEKLEVEMEDMQKTGQNSVIVQEEIRINDEFDMNRKVEKFSVTTTERTMILSQQEPETDMEQDETVSEPEEHAVSQPIEADLVDFNDKSNNIEDENQGRAQPTPESPTEVAEGLPDMNTNSENRLVPITEASEAGMETPPKIESAKVEKTFELQEAIPKTKQLWNQEPPKREDFFHISSVREETPEPGTTAASAVPLEKNEVSEKAKEDEDDNWLSWDVVHFLLLLSPYDDDEVTWWTIVFEAVKCSLRNCPNTSTHWHTVQVYLPRITRHRRQDDDFDPEVAPPPKTTPCPCKNLQKLYENIYELIQKKNNFTTN